jgi:hypothetical protein
MLWHTVILVTLVPALGLLAASAATYADVAAILEKRCLPCHSSGEIGTMPLTSYEQVRPWARAIRDAVAKRVMPPWFAESGTLRFANDPRLTDAEIALIREWVNAGAPRGTEPAASAPAPAARWHIGQPGLVVEMPQPVHLPAEGELPYQWVVLPVDSGGREWIDAVEIRPGERRAVHHAVAYVLEPGDDWLGGAPHGQPFTRAVATKADILAIYTPGQQAAAFEPGLAKHFPSGAAIALQLHYTPFGTSASDRTSIGIRWAREKPARRVLTLQIATTDIRIPPGERNHHVSASGSMPNDATLLSLFPHMHLRGKAFEYSLAEPGGKLETLLRVAPYNFHWQLNYIVAAGGRPLKKGVRLRCDAWYDNSPNNPRNPDPSAEVIYGEQSTDEMMVGFFDAAVPADVDKKAFFVR